MKNSQAWREEIVAATAKIDAIVAVATEEKRELLPDEQAVVDELQGTADKPGTLADLQANYDRQIKIEARITSAIQTQRPEFVFGGEGTEQLFRIPAKAKRQSFDKRFFSCIEDAYASGQWCAAAIYGNAKSQEWCRDNGIWNAMSEGINEKGGFLVPEIFETSVIRVVEDFGVFRRNSFIWPMTTDTTNIPRRTGGFTVYYPAENQDGTLSDLAFGNVKLTAKDPTVVTKISNQLNEDSAVALAGILSLEFGLALANAEDQAGFNGDGTSTYGGIVGLKNALTTYSTAEAITGHTAFSTLTMADFEEAQAMVPAYAGLQPKWYISSQGFYAAMQRLQIAAGGNSVTDIANGGQMMFLGAPVVFVQVLPTTQAAQVSTIVAYYGDLRMGSSFGNRKGLTITRDSSIYFLSKAIAVMCTERYDIVVHEVGSATAVGPIVAIKTPAS